ncbi:MAG: hypothetical protein K2O03_14100, partial [Lachnospiraceae bacterium]|nr:hypothetical protein [Lachnospiraceae bacterium]
YIVTVGERDLYIRLVGEILQKCGIDFVEGLPDHVEVTTRSGDGFFARFIFNNTAKAQEFVLDERQVSLQPFEMQVETVKTKQEESFM